jgi:hypothetical protein
MLLARPRLLALGACLAIGVAVSPARAATIPVPGGGFDWRSLTSFSLNGNGTPYFDHDSWDGSPPGGPGGIWPILNAHGIDDSHLQFWGESDGDPDPNIKFDLAPGAESTSLTLKFEVAGNASVNQFGWFPANLGGNGYQDSDLHLIFDGSAEPGDSAVVTLPGGAYGFYLRNPSTSQVFLSRSGMSPTDEDKQHFAVFRDTDAPGTLWIAVEDLKLASGDRDYNDFVVTAAVQTPEPGTLALLASGLAAVGFGLRRRRGHAPDRAPRS